MITLAVNPVSAVVGGGGDYMAGNGGAWLGAARRGSLVQKGV